MARPTPEALARAVKRRTNQSASLPVSAVSRIVDDAWKLCQIKPEGHPLKAHDKLVHIFAYHLSKAADETADPSSRRRSFGELAKLFKKVDDAACHPKNIEDDACNSNGSGQMTTTPVESSVGCEKSDSNVSESVVEDIVNAKDIPKVSRKIFVSLTSPSNQRAGNSTREVGAQNPTGNAAIPVAQSRNTVSLHAENSNRQPSAETASGSSKHYDSRSCNGKSPNHERNTSSTGSWRTSAEVSAGAKLNDSTRSGSAAHVHGSARDPAGRSARQDRSSVALSVEDNRTEATHRNFMAHERSNLATSKPQATETGKTNGSNAHTSSNHSRHDSHCRDRSSSSSRHGDIPVGPSESQNRQNGIHAGVSTSIDGSLGRNEYHATNPTPLWNGHYSTASGRPSGDAYPRTGSELGNRWEINRSYGSNPPNYYMPSHDRQPLNGPYSSYTRNEHSRSYSEQPLPPGIPYQNFASYSSDPQSHRASVNGFHPSAAPTYQRTSTAVDRHLVEKAQHQSEKAEKLGPSTHLPKNSDRSSTTNASAVSTRNKVKYTYLKCNNGRQTFTAKPDKPQKNAPPYSSAVKERVIPKTIVFDQMMPSNASGFDVVQRLQKWDPFWEISDHVFVGQTAKVIEPKILEARTAMKVDIKVKDLAQNYEQLIKRSEWGPHVVRSIEHGDYSLLFRMLPLKPCLKKRADCHLWPKGTFLQINDIPVRIDQRKQQAHDPVQWKLLCKHLDLTQHVREPKQPIRIEVCCYDEEPYLFCIAFCRYRSPEKVFAQTLDRHSPLAITQRSRREGLERAAEFCKRATICLDSDDEGEEELSKFIFPLSCPLTKTLMSNPVRGKACKHWQCFDLEDFIGSSAPVSASRWRCACCECFLSLDDIELCCLTKDMLHEFKGQANVTRDRIEFNSNRTYRLLDDNPIRSNSQKRAFEKKSSDPKNSKKSKGEITHTVIEL